MSKEGARDANDDGDVESDEVVVKVVMGHRALWRAGSCLTNGILSLCRFTSSHEGCCS